MGIAAAGVGYFGLKFNATMEQNRVAFTHFLGSTEKANAYLDRLYKLAATTPFEFADLTTGAKRMMAFGSSANSAYTQLKTIGDTAAGLGTGTEGINRMVTALGQMQVAGVVQGDELRQFQEAGVNVYKYMIKAGLITQKDVGQIGNLHISSAKAIDAIMKGMQKDFGGMSAEQAKTWTGQLSTMKDYAAQAAGALTEPIFNLLKSNVFPKINEALQGVAKWARGGGVKRAGHAFQTAFSPPKTGDQEIFVGFEGKVAAVASVLGKAFRIGKQAVLDFWDAIKPAQPFLQNVLLPLLKGLAIGIIGSVVVAFKIAIPLLKLFAITLGFIGKLMAPFRGVFTLLGMAIGFLFGGAILKTIGLLFRFGGVFRIVGGAARVFGFVIRFAVGIIRGYIAVLRFVGGILLRVLMPALRLGAAGFRLISGAARSAAAFIRDRFGGVITFIRGLGGKISSAARGMWDGLKNAFKAALNWIIGKWNGLNFRIPSVKIFGKKIGGGEIGTPNIPPLARGGVVQQSGFSIVGERGPELQWMPTGAVVSPLPTTGAIPEPIALDSSAVAGGPFVAKLYLDSSQVAETVFKRAEDRMARR